MAFAYTAFVERVCCKDIFKQGIFFPLQTWKKRWVVASGTTVRYYKKRDDPDPIRTLDLQDCLDCGPDTSNEFGFRLHYVFSLS